MNRFVTALAAGVLVGSVATASPAMAEAKKGPKLGAWTCSSGGEVPFATLDLFKGNKYAANGDTEKSKYVYKAGQKKLKFKDGVWAEVFYGLYDKETKTITLYSVTDDSEQADCTQPTTEPTEPTEPTTEG